MGFVGFMYRQLFFKPKPIPADISLTGRTVIVTGSNTGLGLEAAKEIVAHNASHIILGVRNLSKGEEARQELLSTHPQCEIEVWELDSESFASVIKFGERANALDRLDIVLLNAGTSKTEWIKSPSGHETTIQVNHLATALLSILLLPPLQSTSKISRTPSRMTIISSEVHMWTPMKERSAPNILRKMDEKNTFATPERYNTSKLLNVLWARELASRIESSQVVINTVNPGLCWTSLHRDDPSAVLRVFKNIFAWTAAQGGHCLLDAATVQQAESHGGYISEQKMIQ